MRSKQSPGSPTPPSKKPDTVEVFNLRFQNFEDKAVKTACGITKEQLMQLGLYTSLDAQMIFEFLCICKQGISQNFAAILSNNSQATVSKNFNTVLSELMKNFVPMFLGPTAFSRDSIMNDHTPGFIKSIFGNVRGVIDGKISNYIHIFNII